MIPTINWLHISDIHLRIGQEWQQRHVLKALQEGIKKYVFNGHAISFILVSGDLAYSGSEKEYLLAEQFISELSDFAMVPRELIFCIPGNHDVERNKQKLAFRGARQQLQNQSEIDSLLADGDELNTLLLRINNYKRFQEKVFARQERKYTDSKLSYVSSFSVNDVKFSIIGLNTAWLSEGDITDNGKLLIGERQIIDSIELAKKENPNIMISMGHHPFHLLHECDRITVQLKVEEACQFYHCGHLHEPELKNILKKGSQCIIISAGASFETRFTQNSFSIISLEIEKGICSVATSQYNSQNNNFSIINQEQIPIIVSSAELCSIDELATAIIAFDKEALCPNYLAALLLGYKSEFPFHLVPSFIFVNISVLEKQPDGEFKSKTIHFIQFQNLLKIFNIKNTPLEILLKHGEGVQAYIELINRYAKTNYEFLSQLKEREVETRKFSRIEPKSRYSHTFDLLMDFKENQEWDNLKQLSERHVHSDDNELSLLSEKMLALSLSHSGEESDLSLAILIWKKIFEEKKLDFGEFSVLIALLINRRNFDEAKSLVLGGLKIFVVNNTVLKELGLKIVSETGDRKFRDLLLSINN